jgi:hypothetical protein
MIAISRKSMKIAKHFQLLNTSNWKAIHNIHNLHKIMNNKRKSTWDRLKQQMGNKRAATTTPRTTKGSSAPHEIIVQRLASEPDNKQTFRPVQPREFVNFPYEELSLVNLKKACASHFSLTAATCDV